MPDTGNIISIAGICGSCLSAILLIAFNKGRKVEQYMLALIFLILSWYAFFHPSRVYALLSSYPFILRMGVPFYYLVPPFIFWYTGIKLFDYRLKSKSLLLHLLPFFIGLTDIAWYYSHEYERLHDIALAVAQNFDNLFKTAEGFLPAVTHYILRPIQGCIYCVWSCYLCYAAYKKGSFKKFSFSMRAWLMLFNVAMAGIYLMLFYITILNPPEDWRAIGNYGGWWPALAISCLFLLLGVAIFFCPSVIYERKKEQGEIAEPQKPVTAFAGHEITTAPVTGIKLPAENTRDSSQQLLKDAV